VKGEEDRNSGEDELYYHPRGFKNGGLWSFEKPRGGYLKQFTLFTSLTFSDILIKRDFMDVSSGFLD
jgi:hypothetical protein